MLTWKTLYGLEAGNHLHRALSGYVTMGCSDDEILERAREVLVGMRLYDAGHGARGDVHECPQCGDLDGQELIPKDLGLALVKLRDAAQELGACPFCGVDWGEEQTCCDSCELSAVLMNIEPGDEGG